MATAQIAVSSAIDRDETKRVAEVSYQDGVVGGLLGAATIALWFLLIDIVHGRPLYTPTVLGTALFGGGAGLDAPASLPASGELVFLFTWVHALVFVALGGIVARLIAVAERNPNLGFGILMLFVLLEGVFLLGSFLFAETVLHALAWPEVLVGNLLAALAMGGYFWRRHPDLRIQP